MRKLIILLTALVALGSCDSNRSAKESADSSVSGDTVTVTPDSPLSKRIQTSAVELKEYNPSFTASGEVRAIPSRYAEIAMPFSGRIVSSLVDAGTRVSVGTPLFRINSGDFMEVVRAAYDARTEKEQAERALARASRMFESKMASARELEEAQADFDIKNRAAQNAAATLRVFGADISSLAPGEPLTVKSPIAGTVVTNRLVNGQYVKDDAEPGIVIADLSKVWVVANVKEKDFALLKGIDEVGITIDATPDTVFSGRVFHVNDILDPATRSVELIVECDNHDGIMKPNMFGTVHITDAATKAVLVPTKALRRKNDLAYVMQAIGNNRYKGVIVATGPAVGDCTVVTDGLSRGDMIVTEGAFYLPEPEL